MTSPRVFRLSRAMMPFLPLLFDLRPLGASPGRWFLRVEGLPPVLQIVDLMWVGSGYQCLRDFDVRTWRGISVPCGECPGRWGDRGRCTWERGSTLCNELSVLSSGIPPWGLGVHVGQIGNVALLCQWLVAIDWSCYCLAGRRGK